MNCFNELINKCDGNVRVKFCRYVLGDMLISRVSPELDTSQACVVLGFVLPHDKHWLQYHQVIHNEFNMAVRMAVDLFNQKTQVTGIDEKESCSVDGYFPTDKINYLLSLCDGDVNVFCNMPCKKCRDIEFVIDCSLQGVNKDVVVSDIDTSGVEITINSDLSFVLSRSNDVNVAIARAIDICEILRGS